MKKILAVDDEQDIRTLLKESLELEGYLVYTAKNGMEAMEGLKYHPDLIILDVNMPDLDGYTVCEKIRDYIDCPILFLTARTQEQDRVNGFKAGGDDYIVKPFSPGELVARVKAHINIHEHLKSQNGCNEAKSNDFETGSIRVANLKIFPLSRQVFCSDREVEMANKEFELLYFLASNPNIVFSKDALFDKIWGMDAIGGTATVAVHINRIREKIGTDKENLKLIETVWGAGYRFSV